MRHYVFGGGKPVHHGHHHIHRNHVRPRLKAELDGAPAVAGLADDFDVRVAVKNTDKSFAHGHGVFDNKDANCV
jgi:hypothetical protein